MHFHQPACICVCRCFWQLFQRSGAHHLCFRHSQTAGILFQILLNFLQKSVSKPHFRLPVQKIFRSVYGKAVCFSLFCQLPQQYLRRLFRNPQFRSQSRNLKHFGSALLQQKLRQFFLSGCFFFLKPFQSFLSETLFPAHIRLQHNASADCLQRRIKPQDKTVSPPERRVCLQPKLCVPFFSRRKLIRIQKRRPAEHLGCAAVKMKPALILHRSL